jgi:ADP-ribose pyrophosphatase YjhB (NUDIX family)
MGSIYSHTKNNPYHLSVGVILVNEDGKVACHHHTDLKAKGFDFDELYLLMRETVEDGESLYEAIDRGLAEEFGLSGEVTAYLGSTRSVIHEPNGDYNWEKTTVYFACKYTGGLEGGRLATDPESGSDIEWRYPHELAIKMRDLGVISNRELLDESEILERFIKSREK